MLSKSKAFESLRHPTPCEKWLIGDSYLSSIPNSASVVPGNTNTIIACPVRSVYDNPYDIVTSLVSVYSIVTPLLVPPQGSWSDVGSTATAAAVPVVAVA